MGADTWSPQRTGFPTASDGVGLQSLAVLLDRPISGAALDALGAHLGPLPADVRAWIIRVASRSAREDGVADARWQDDLAVVARALRHEGRTERRTVVGAFDAAARSLDQPSTLNVVLDGAGAEWALRHARGSMLLLPTEGTRPARPRAVLIARHAAEVERLASWTVLLAPGVEVVLRAVFDPTADAPARVLRELTALQTALETARARLVASGRAAVTGCVLEDDDPPEAEATLVVRVARRGLLRRLLPGPDARAWRRRPCARLLLAP